VLAVIKTDSIPGFTDINMQTTCGERPWSGSPVFCCSFSRSGMANDNYITQDTFKCLDINYKLLSIHGKINDNFLARWRQSHCIYNLSNTLSNQPHQSTDWQSRVFHPTEHI